MKIDHIKLIQLNYHYKICSKINIEVLAYLGILFLIKTIQIIR
jgi:hypothetical protein